jgi:tRNA(Ile)-lysidine synthase
MTRPTSPITAPPNADLVATLRAVQAQAGIFPPPDPAAPTPVVVGVSGGVDSVCLLHALRQVAGEWGLALHVAHLDHGLRPDSAADAAFVEALAAEWGLPFHSQQLLAGALTGQPGGIEAAARRARYAFLARTAINVSPPPTVPLVVVAHHADDQAETLLLQLVRGSGLQGLGAMRLVTTLPHQDKTIRLVRPLLGVRRSSILAYAAAHDLRWCEDDSNQSHQFARNRIRHALLPLLAELNPNIVATLGRTAEVLAADSQRLAQIDRATLQALWLTDSVATGLDGQTPLDRIVLDLDQLLALDQAAQRGVLRQALALLASDGDNAVEFSQLESLLVHVRQRPVASGPHPLLGDLVWTVVGRTAEQPLRLSLHRAKTLPVLPDYPYLDLGWRQTIGAIRLQDHAEIAIPGGWRLQRTLLAPEQLPSNWQQESYPWRAYLDVDQLGEVMLTTPRPGLRVAPLGLQGRHKLLGDLFTDRKIPAALRPGWPIMLDEATGTVHWVCGLAVGHGARLTGDTRRIVCLHWQRGAEPPCGSMSNQ